MTDSPKQASGTAMATAFLRAMAAYDPRADIRGPDHLAEAFLDEEHSRPLKDPKARAWVLQNKVGPGAYEFMLARTAFFDDVVTQALKADIGQIVFLGAGYDSRPYRFTSLIAHTRIFELDAEPTQRRKRECLEHAQIQIPARVTFVPVDFETDDLGATLLQAGFEAGKQSLFVWEGVTYYLSAEAVDHMLAFVRRNSAAGSSIAFDYAALSDETLNEQAARQLREHLRGQHGDEPTKFGIPVGGLATFLAARGFEVREHLTASGMKQKYLGGQRTDLGDVPSLLCLVHTRVVGGK